MENILPQPSADWPTQVELTVATVGACEHPSPIPARDNLFVDERRRVLLCSDSLEMEHLLASGAPLPTFEAAGPRARVFADPSRLTCGIVTCGGLCPGLNNVVRSVFMQLTHAYGVPRILGFRYGYAGIAQPDVYEPVVLTDGVVSRWHEHGGTFLGSSRGPQDLGVMVGNLERLQVGLLFVVGGDGGLRGASALADEIRRRGRRIGVVGVPKTIDNDLSWMARSFGFDTAVDAARSVILAAHAEARGAWNGIGLVKLMGRESGFIAAHATLASADVNFCLVPEVPFTLDGRGGFFEALGERLALKHHAVVVVAEGAGQELMQARSADEHDASGNVKLQDIGVFLRDEMARYFAGRQPVTIRYIDPSYTIRSLPTNSIDSQFCLALGQHAVHAGMAGRTDTVVGLWNQRFAHVPIPLAVGRRKKIDPEGEVWDRVLETTGQPVSLIGN